jgi:hypothetical protein
LQNTQDGFYHVPEIKFSQFIARKQAIELADIRLRLGAPIYSEFSINLKYCIGIPIQVSLKPDTIHCQNTHLLETLLAKLQC